MSGHSIDSMVTITGAEYERLKAENANLLAANRDLQDWWDDLRPDHKRLQEENEVLRAVNDALSEQMITMIDNASKVATLRSDNERLRAALDAIREATDMGLATSMQGAPYLITNVHTLARAALGEKP